MDGNSLITLVLWFAALGLVMWRWPNGDRFKPRACVLAAAIWVGLALWDRALRTNPMYWVAVATILTLRLSDRPPATDEPTRLP